ncbi:MAG: cadmium-translocating P-type ATPase [Anaerolineaceae bacterium]|nr:cadmium-translocating P-type ATPase [Anaerolineaceae bacterium]
MAQQTYRIGHMDCANCAKEVETGVRKLEGIRSVQVDFATGKMTLDGEVTEAILRQRVESLGKTLENPETQKEAAQPLRGGVLGFWDYLAGRRETRLALIGGGGVLATLAVSLLFNLPESVSGVFYTLFMLVTLYPIARSGINTLRINREFNINLLMTIAAVGAVIIGEYLESATVIFLFAVGEALEGYTADRARDSLRSLLDLAPPHALRLHGDHEDRVPVEDLRIDDRILVKPGERIPMDGEVAAGNSSANQAPITGESMPVHKGIGDTVYAGSINGEGALEIRITRLAQDNTLNRIIQLVEEAQSRRAPSQRMIDRFAHYYTPGVVILALLVATVPPLLFNAPFFDTPDGHGWFYRALSMLVIACPCALVISTPVTVISAITAAARRGVLIKGGAHLEALGTIRAIAFDKTGTLTAGQPAVTTLHSVDCETGEPCMHCDDVLALAAAVEKRSTHPLAQAVLNAAKAHDVLDQYAPAADVAVLAGRGVQGQVDGRLVTVGSHHLFENEYPHPKDLCAKIDSAEAQGQTAMLLSDGDRVRGYIAVADEPRESSAAVVRDLNTLGLTTVMLTGDNARAADSIGQAVGVRDVRANLMPEDKVDAVQGLLRQYGQVAMVGDGVNDTPALAAATVGIAMGGAGSAQALETADIALMADDLTQLPAAMRLARFARTLIKQNVALSLGLKAVFLLLAVFGGVSLWAAVFADVGMALIVTLNGMRPLRQSR